MFFCSCKNTLDAKVARVPLPRGKLAPMKGDILVGEETPVSGLRRK
jgi:hypothetical protein